MAVGLGMKVESVDGQDLGRVDRLILDPATDAVKAAVIRKGHILPRDIEVPVEQLQQMTEGVARVPYRADEVDRLPQFEERNYTSPPVDYVPPAGYPLSGLYWPIGFPGFGGVGSPLLGEPRQPIGGVADAGVESEVRAALRQEDLNNAVIGPGSDVLARDGSKVGTIKGLNFHPERGDLTSFVLHKGILFGKDEELPASLIEAVDDGVVHLVVNADQLPG